MRKRQGAVKNAVTKPNLNSLTECRGCTYIFTYICTTLFNVSVFAVLFSERRYQFTNVKLCVKIQHVFESIASVKLFEKIGPSKGYCIKSWNDEETESG